MPRSTVTPAQAAAVVFARDVAQLWDRQLGQRLIGIYLIGSLAHGGFSALDKLTSDDHKRYLRALLYPARFVYSWETGAIGSNDEAVAFLQGRATGLDLDVIRRALRCRNEDQDPQALFSERSKLPGLVRV